MITDFFLLLIVGLLQALNSTLPVWNIVPDPSKLVSMTQALTLYNSVLPVTETFAAVSLLFAVFAATHGLSWGRKLISLFSGGGGA